MLLIAWFVGIVCGRAILCAVSSRFSACRSGGSFGNLGSICRWDVVASQISVVGMYVSSPLGVCQGPGEMFWVQITSSRQMRGQQQRQVPQKPMGLRSYACGLSPG